MKKDFYTNTLDDVKEMIDEKKYTDAYIILKKELSMPYIPSIYEGEFIMLLNKVEFNIKDDKEKGDTPIDTLIEMLSGEKEMKGVAISQLRKHNLRNVKDELKRVIDNLEEEFVNEKIYLFELLAEQDIDMDVVIKGKKLNTKRDSVFDKDIEIAYRMIEELGLKNPQITELAKKELYRFAMLTFPDKNHDWKKIGEAIFNICLRIVTNENTLTEFEDNIFKVLNSQ